MEVPVVFYHQDFAKTAGQMFQWPPGENIYIQIQIQIDNLFFTREQRSKDSCEEIPDESVGGQIDAVNDRPEGFCQGELGRDCS